MRSRQIPPEDVSAGPREPSREAPPADEICPRCGYTAPPEVGAFEECPACGVILAKFRAAQHREPPRDPAPRQPDTPAASASAPDLWEPEEQYVPPKTFSQIRREHEATPLATGFDREFGIGVAIGVVLWLVPLSRGLVAYLSVLVHEIGHTAAGWLFGYPTIPSFDFVNHGGVSVFFFRWESLTVLISALLLLWWWQARGWRRIQVLAITTLIVYLVFTWTPLHNLVFDAMGHGGELLFATVFLYRGLRPSFHFESLERPAWAAAGSFVTLHHLAFAFTLATSAARQREYLQGVRGFRHDLHRLVDWSGLPLTVIAALLVVLACSPPLLAWWLHRHHQTWRNQLVSALTGRSEQR